MVEHLCEDEGDYFHHHLVPVSYTHLDVYKRQAILRLTLKGMGELDQILRQKIDPEKDLAIHLREGENDKNPFVWIESIPVSYTHLDVYKRQPQNDKLGGRDCHVA